MRTNVHEPRERRISHKEHEGTKDTKGEGIGGGVRNFFVKKSKKSFIFEQAKHQVRRIYRYVVFQKLPWGGQLQILLRMHFMEKRKHHTKDTKEDKDTKEEGKEGKNE